MNSDVKPSKAPAMRKQRLAALAVAFAFGMLATHANAVSAGATSVDPAGETSKAVLTPTTSPAKAALDPEISGLCQRARRGEVDATYQLAWLYAYGKGVDRNDAYASYLFFAASSAGHEDAKRMLIRMSWPAAEVPKCMEDSAENRYVPNGAVVTVEAPPAIAKIVEKLAPKYQLDPKLVLAFIAVESKFDVFALSPKNAMGLMQLMPKTTERFRVNKPFDAQDNIRGGMAYLRWLLAYFEGDLVLVSAAYNAGEGAVEKHLGVPPYPETQEYVQKILERVGVVQHPFDAKVTKPSAALPLINKTAKLN